MAQNTVYSRDAWTLVDGVEAARHRRRRAWSEDAIDATVSSRETRRLSCDHEDGVEAIGTTKFGNVVGRRVRAIKRVAPSSSHARRVHPSAAEDDETS